jgi:DNA-binding GntR family transcriptional regulator
MTSSIQALAEQIDRRREATPDMVVQVLREAILSGVLRSGEFIRQDLVAAELKVSKTPVREALLRLEAEGLIQFHRNRGAVVSELSLLEITETFDIRIALETLALGLAMPNMSTVDFDRANRAIEDADHRQDDSQLGQLNWQFHNALYAPCKRPLLLSMIKNLHSVAGRYVRLQRSLTHSELLSQSEHRDILAACRNGNVKTAQKILRDHMKTAADRLIRYLEANGF